MTDLKYLYSLTPLQWQRMVRGYNHRIIDRREEYGQLAIMIGQYSNGKSLSKFFRSFEKAHKDLDMSEEQKLKEQHEKSLLKKITGKALSKWSEQFKGMEEKL